MKITLKHVVIGLAIIAFIFFFLPYFETSTGDIGDAIGGEAGEAVGNLVGSAMESMGMDSSPSFSPSAMLFNSSGQYDISGIVLAAFGLFPLATIGLWIFFKDPTKVKLKGLISAGLAGLLIIFHFVLASNDALSQMNKTIVFWLGIIIQLVIVIISLMVAFGKASEDETDLKGFASSALEEGKNAAQNAKQNAQNVAQNAQAAGKNFAEAYQKAASAKSAGKTCPNCGAEMDDDSMFCMECGAKYVEPAKEETINLAGKKMCINCGNHLDEDELFCPMCGTKYEERVCSNCGAKIKEGASFCGKCGTKY